MIGSFYKIFKSVLFISFFSPILVFSQSKKAEEVFEEAVKSFNAGKYEQADSLFTLSLNIEPSREAYYNRAITRGKKADRNGYCRDLATASSLRDKRATRMYLKSCGKIDTTLTWYRKDNLIDSMSFRTLKYYLNDSVLFVFDGKKNQVDALHLYSKNETGISSDSVLKVVETNAEFPGGVDALMNFIKKNIREPRGNFTYEKVFAKFVINEDGRISDISILKGSDKCPKCNEEAIRVISLMPLWIPATLNGVEVKCYFNLPVSFRNEN